MIFEKTDESINFWNWYFFVFVLITFWTKISKGGHSKCLAELDAIQVFLGLIRMQKYPCCTKLLLNNNRSRVV